MFYPKSVRDKLGISHEAFANLIQCNAGLLSMVELGRRSLSATSLLQAGLIEKAISQVDSMLPTSVKPNTKEILLLERSNRSRQLIAERNKQNIEILEKKYEQNVRLLRLCQAFETEPFLPDQGEAHAQMKILKRKAEKKLTRLREEWIKLKISVAGLQAEIAMAEEIKIS